MGKLERKSILYLLMIINNVFNVQTVILYLVKDKNSSILLLNKHWSIKKNVFHLRTAIHSLLSVFISSNSYLSPGGSKIRPMFSFFFSSVTPQKLWHLNRVCRLWFRYTWLSFVIDISIPLHLPFFQPKG